MYLKGQIYHLPKFQDICYGKLVQYVCHLKCTVENLISGFLLYKSPYI